MLFLNEALIPPLEVIPSSTTLLLVLCDFQVAVVLCRIISVLLLSKAVLVLAQQFIHLMSSPSLVTY